MPRNCLSFLRTLLPRSHHPTTHPQPHPQKCYLPPLLSLQYLSLDGFYLFILRCTSLLCSSPNISSRYYQERSFPPRLTTYRTLHLLGSQDSNSFPHKMKRGTPYTAEQKDMIHTHIHSWLTQNINELLSQLYIFSKLFCAGL